MPMNQCLILTPTILDFVDVPGPWRKFVHAIPSSRTVHCLCVSFQNIEPMNQE